jgi:hypothetical protein
MREAAQPQPVDLVNLREASDEEVLRTILELSDEASSLHRRSGEVVLLLDHLLAVVGERWAPEAMTRIEDEERAELESESVQRCNSVREES